MKSTNILIFPFLLLFIAFIACQKEEDFIRSAPTTSLQLNYVSKDGQTLNDLEQLGRVLFYDRALSDNHSVSCGSCHRQSFAFADNKKFSGGMERLLAARNTPALQNLGSGSFTLLESTTVASSPSFFWDGRINNFNAAVTAPFFNPIEMGLDNTGELIQRVKGRLYYHELFDKAFQDSDVDMMRISTALAAFVERLRANDSFFDQHRFDASIAFSPALPEGRGMSLFFGKYDCSSCHNLHSDIGYNPADPNQGLVNIGLDKNYTDNGRAEITHRPADRGKFKIPNLRNVALTAPYMHDGRFETLEEVIDHYSAGIAHHSNLDDRLKSPSGQPLRLNITTQEKMDLIAFLNTLTSQDLLTNPLLSNPFIAQ